MTRRAFRVTNFSEQRRALIDRCNRIIAGYTRAGYRLTLRQLYYQLVIRNIIRNHEREYKRLSNLISDARLAGLIDWAAIEDRVRVPKVPQEFANLGALVDTALATYRLPRWKGQRFYVELWVEKDALAGVLAPIAHEYHVTLMVNKGYSSQSAMYESAQRFIRRMNFKKTPKCPVLLYLGDHDPSGEDMVRDIRDRLVMFGVHGLTMHKLALTMDQVEAYNPPPNPAKVSDPRAEAYIAEHGASSWEVDALPPDVLVQLIRDALDRFVDRPRMDAIIAQEERDRTALRAAFANIHRNDIPPGADA